MPIALPVALLAGSAISAGGGIASSLIGSNAASSAANTEAQAAQNAAGLAQAAGQTANSGIANVLGQESGLLSPYASQGTAGLQALSAAVAPGGSLSQQFSYNPQDVANDPAYQFQLQQGLQAVQRAAAATGTLGSGGTLKALTNYGQGVASSYENQDYNQAQNTFNTNRNATLQNIQLPIQAGEYGTSGMLSALQNYGNLFSQNTLGTAQIIGNDLTGKANAQAQGVLGQANAYSSGIGSAANALGGGLSLSSIISALTGGQQAAPQTTLPNYNALPYGVTGAGAGVLPAGVTQAAPSAFSSLSPYATPAYGAPNLSTYGLVG